MSGDLAAAMDNALLVFKAESPARSLIVADEKSEVTSNEHDWGGKASPLTLTLS